MEGKGLNKRPIGLDALLTKLLHQHNLQNFGRDPSQDASHKNFKSIGPGTPGEIVFENWAENMKKKCSISIISIILVETLPSMLHMKFEVNRSTNFRGDRV